MAELVEGARLEIVFTGNRNKGSNPFLSATKRKPAIIEIAGFSLFSGVKSVWGWEALAPQLLH